MNPKMKTTHAECAPRNRSEWDRNRSEWIKRLEWMSRLEGGATNQAVSEQQKLLPAVRMQQEKCTGAHDRRSRATSTDRSDASARAPAPATTTALKNIHLLRLPSSSPRSSPSTPSVGPRSLRRRHFPTPSRSRQCRRRNPVPGPHRLVVNTAFFCSFSCIQHIFIPFW